MVVMYLFYNQHNAIKRLERLGYDNLGVRTVIVDDGSKTPLKCEWAEVYRIDEDMPWNMPQANNLGFSKIRGEVVLRLDMDHYFEPEDLIKLSKIELQDKQIIKFKRTFNGKTVNVGKNIYLARVDDIVNVGGYNEVFCGNYGYEDADLMDRLKRAGFKVTISNIICKVDNNFTTGLNRDTTINYRKYKQLNEKSTM